MKTLLFLFMVLVAGNLAAQVGINNFNGSPDPSAGLDVNFSNKGMLAPRMNFVQRNAIANPADGLMVICSDCNFDGTGTLSIFLGGQWINLTGNCTLPLSPPEGVHGQSNGQIVWNWGAVPIANGYKWNYINDYASAIYMASATTKTETGLVAGASYDSYVWSYNACGRSEPTRLSAQALSCGSNFSVVHDGGNVAPVDKTVTYGTVNNIPGETAKCWITKNLGATNQAVFVNDATEASAGWYWRFNRIQGYQHNGTVSTPSWTVISIDEEIDWALLNDPCYLLLGVAWRIPTGTEWSNVKNSGGWTNWNGPWNSSLKLHAAGSINNFSGMLANRGSEGVIWSSSTDGTQHAFGLSFANFFASVGNIPKGYGIPLRCIRE